jgi:glyoxylase-like metal-dependent hydrolase (beta-lactamase superfamily II)/rhodanese-related sulfurtransferase
LGDNSYLLASGGEALVVDPQRDAWRFVSAAEARGLRIVAVVETHVHNDYLTGALEIRDATGAEVCAPARGAYEFPHRPMAEGDEIALGAVRIQAMETPGHTPEHLAYVAREASDGEPVAAFTGGSLMVGSAGRTDLLGPELTDELTRAQFRTMRRLASLPDAAQVLPTHGGGSFCASGGAGDRRTSTIGHERTTNPAFGAADEEAFVHDRLRGLLEYPAYYAHMAEINRRGPRVLGRVPDVPPLDPAAFARSVDEGAWVVDARRRTEFAAAHVPGSLNVELSSSFGTYVGWVVPFDHPLALVLPDPPGAASEAAATQLLRIGYERIAGRLDGGVGAWTADGRPAESYATTTVEDLCRAVRSGAGPHVLDVRQPAEWETGAFPDSQGVFMGDLPGRLGEIPHDRESWVICASGQRASVAASLLARDGAPVRLVADGGVDELLTICGPYPLAKQA